MRLTHLRLTEANVRNTTAIDDYLQQYIQACRNQQGKKFFATQGRKWIINHEDEAALVKTKEVYPNDPEWAHKAHAARQLYDFVGLSREAQDAFQHIVDGVNEIGSERPELLERLPTLTVEGAINLINDFYKRRMGGEMIPLSDGEKAIITYPDGARWVELTTPEALTREGSGMGHCVAGYRGHLGNDNEHFYSYRDSRNRPHITIHAFGKNLSQVKGRQNRPPISRYISRLLDFLNKGQFRAPCHDTDRMDVVRSGGRWKMFDPEQSEEEIFTVPLGDGRFCRVSYDRGKVRFLPDDGGETILMQTHHLDYEPRVPMLAYKYVIDTFNGKLAYNFDTVCLHENIDRLPIIVEELKKLQKSWKYVRVKDAQFVVRGVEYYFVVDGSGIVYDTHNRYDKKLPLEYKLVLATKLGFPMDQATRLSLLGSMSPAKAKEMAKKIKGTTGGASLTLDDPRVKHLPDDLNVPNTLKIGPECNIKKLPDGLKIRRDLNLAGTKVRQLGANTEVKRNLRLGNSLVKRLPSGLVIGGGTELRGCLDLRGSLVTAVPGDLKLLPQRQKDRWNGRNTYYTHSEPSGCARIIIAPGQKVRIPKHLQPFVEVKKYTPDDTEIEDSYEGNSRP
jgi:hypothetical protein